MKRALLRIAITGINALADNPGPGVAVAKCLRESCFADVQIIGLGYDALDPGFYLPQYFDKCFLIPYPSAGETALVDRLKSIHEKYPIDILIPCLDAELTSYVRIEHLLNEIGVNTYLPSADKIRLRSKDHLEELARLAQISCPPIKPISSTHFFDDCEDHGWQFPLVVKGVFYDAKIVKNKTEAIAAFQHIASEWGYPVLVQEYVKGEEYNLSGIGDGNGQLLNPVMMKKLAVTSKGKAWAGVSIKDHALLNAANALVKAIQWKGPLEVEVMKDEHGKYQLIEINPRFPAWIYLSVGVGRNLPETLIQLILGEAVYENTKLISGKIFIRYAEETLIDIHDFEKIVMQGNPISGVINDN